jgi:PIN domain nuclease of toxin-antitoxin system
VKLLLDTHILIWYLEGHPNLPEAQRLMIEDRRNQVAVSAASLWEMAIKFPSANSNSWMTLLR